MMGQHDRSEALFYYFRLEDQVPETHLLRLIEKHISFAFVREKLKASYSDTGRPSIDPELLLRILLIERCLPGPHHPPKRTSPTTCAGVGQHARVRQSTAAKKEGGSLVRGTEESDRIAALASAQTEVRARAVLPGSGGPEHQTTGAVPQPTDNTYYGSCRLAEVEWNTGLQRYGEESLPITDFFNTHAWLRQLSSRR